MSEIHDFLLCGKLLKRTITHVYGPPASGKTNLALIATISASTQGRVIYLDPEGGFSTERLKQLTENPEEVLKNILIIEPANFAEQQVAIDKLEGIVAETSAVLVVVDSIGMLYRVAEERDIRALGRQMAELLRISRKYDLPVLVTNQVYINTDNGTITPIGGDALKYWSKVIIELGITGSERFARLHRHPSLPEGTILRFRITQSGIKILSASESQCPH